MSKYDKMKPGTILEWGIPELPYDFGGKPIVLIISRNYKKYYIYFVNNKRLPTDTSYIDSSHLEKCYRILYEP